MFGNFFQKILHANAEEDMNRQEVESQVENAEMWLAISERDRRRRAMDDEEALDDEMAQSRRLRAEIRELRLNLTRIENAHDLLRRQHDYLEQKRVALLEIATNIAVDRRAMYNSLGFLIDSLPAGTQEDLKQKFETWRVSEKKQLKSDEHYMSRVGAEFETALSNKLKQTSPA